MNIRSKKLTEASRGRTCVRCEHVFGLNTTETVVRCHYTGLRQQSYGKGRSIKGHDLVAADLCVHCHNLMDSISGSELPTKELRKIDLSEQFLHYCMMTLIRDWQEGVIKD